MKTQLFTILTIVVLGITFTVSLISKRKHAKQAENSPYSYTIEYNDGTVDSLTSAYPTCEGAYVYKNGDFKYLERKEYLTLNYFK